METNLSFTVRSTGYRLEWLEFRVDDDHVWTLSRLTPPPPGAMAGMALETLTLEATLPVPADGKQRSVVHLVIGPAHAAYEPPAEVRFIRGTEAIPAAFAAASPLAAQ
jgi:hypothetical protein